VSCPFRPASPTIDLPAQSIPVPTVKQPATDEMFDRDYPWGTNTLTGDWAGLRSDLAIAASSSMVVTSPS
jgi:hypothetical protein